MTYMLGYVLMGMDPWAQIPPNKRFGSPKLGFGSFHWAMDSVNPLCQIQGSTRSTLDLGPLTNPSTIMVQLLSDSVNTQ